MNFFLDNKGVRKIQVQIKWKSRVLRIAYLKIIERIVQNIVKNGIYNFYAYNIMAVIYLAVGRKMAVI